MKSSLVPPLNFAMVVPGVYRSGYPNKKNHPFLINYLCPAEYSAENVLLMSQNNIRFIHYRIVGNKEPFTEIDWDEVGSMLELMLDPLNHPMLIHCNKGKHRIGCIVGCLRKLQNWSLTSIYDEYRRFAGEKIRIADQEFIEMFQARVQYQLTRQILRKVPGLRDPTMYRYVQEPESSDPVNITTASPV